MGKWYSEVALLTTKDRIFWGKYFGSFIGDEFLDLDVRYYVFSRVIRVLEIEKDIIKTQLLFLDQDQLNKEKYLTS